ncbi:hypothetical protein K435DRAFT_667177 [Dendrothele bispora CBS 962.96]|uniref:CCHC-type domain-containing protein n=1 Tax=Dendrothele bispora (strain CBS 962.96) TaxID=1314807 RepID=A0A4S8LZ87_DENBC|nr:hypothetical protein K435DRAFT_667177 [Dendrothele bispora CBS 962.96]
MTVKPNLYEVIVEFVPVHANLGDCFETIRIETDSDIQGGDLVKACWIKDPECRKPGQKVAHASLHFRTRQAANKAIKDGLIIAGKPVSVRKPDNFLGLCTKCYKPGHIRATCTCQVDVCGRCAGPHRTPTCDADDEDLWCAECAEKGHCGAAQTDRCPMYIRKNESRKNRNLEGKYRFYVTEEHWTWVQVDQGAEGGVATWEEQVR